MRRNVLTLGAIILITLAVNVPTCVTASCILHSGIHGRTSISLKISNHFAVMSFWLKFFLWCCTIRIMITEYTMIIKTIIKKTGISSTNTKLNFAVVDTLHILGPSVKTSISLKISNHFLLLNPVLDPVIHVLRIREYRDRLNSVCRCYNQANNNTGVITLTQAIHI
jgi:hypothetical protein